MNEIRYGNLPCSVPYKLELTKPYHMADDGIKNMVNYPVRQEAEFIRKSVWIACEEDDVFTVGVDKYNAIKQAGNNFIEL